MPKNQHDLSFGALKNDAKFLYYRYRGALEVCAGDATPMGGGAWHGHYFWCRNLPAHLQDPGIPIHLKEFWVVIVSARLWGDSWSGKCITIWCDNDAVVDTVTHRKPRDPSLLSLLREQGRIPWFTMSD